MPNALDALLDRIEPTRYDIEAIVKRLNEFEDLPPELQDAEEEGIFSYAGADEASHPFTGLCGESHNATFVARDLDGSLRFVFETGSGSGRWEAGLFYPQHISELELEACLEAEDAPEQYGFPITASELRTLIESLPADPPGPLRSF